MRIDFPGEGIAEKFHRLLRSLPPFLQECSAAFLPLLEEDMIRLFPVPVFLFGLGDLPLHIVGVHHFLHPLVVKFPRVVIITGMSHEVFIGGEKFRNNIPVPAKDILDDHPRIVHEILWIPLRDCLTSPPVIVLEDISNPVEPEILLEETHDPRQRGIRPAPPSKLLLQ